MNLLSHYGSQITDFGTLPQYSTEVTEALHKPLKDTHRRSNRVDAAEQILNRITRDYAIRIWELNLIAWSQDVEMPAEVRKMLKVMAADRQDPGRAEQEPKLGRNGDGLGGKQDAGNLDSTPLVSLVEELELLCLTEGFCKELVFQYMFSLHVFYLWQFWCILLGYIKARFWPVLAATLFGHVWIRKDYIGISLVVFPCSFPIIFQYYYLSYSCIILG